jgi:hypothetical protein
MDVYHSNIASSRFADPERKKTYSTQERTSPRSRPEAVKMAPIIKGLEQHPGNEVNSKQTK